MARGIIFDIKRASIDDGPGLRTVVFLKGCPLKCIWCHSPESINPKPELVFYESKCIGCGKCLEICPNGVHRVSASKGREIRWDRCRICGECVEVCYAGALEIKGRETGSEALFQEIEKDRVFYEVSHGGVTFSGGEPFLQHGFLLEVLQKCRDAGIHTAVDTSGYTDHGVVQTLIPFIDLVLFDLKCMDDAVHRELTGVSNEIILRNLSIMARSGSDVLVSFPIIPGYTSSLENLEETLRYIRELGLSRMRLLPYNRIAGSKYRWLGRPYPLEDVVALDDCWMIRAKNLARHHGVDLIVK